MRVVGINIRSKLPRYGGSHWENAELLRMLVKMEDVQFSFPSTRLTFLLLTLPPKMYARAEEEFDTLLECALASMVTGGGEGAKWDWRVPTRLRVVWNLASDKPC